MKKKRKIIYEAIKLLWAPSKRVQFFLLFSLLLTVLTSGLNICIPLALKAVIKQITAHPMLTVGLSTLLVIASYGILWILSQVTNHVRQMIMFVVTEGAVSRLSFDLFSHLHKLPQKFHVKRKFGVIINTIERAEVSLPNVCISLSFFIIPTVIEILLAAGILWHLYGLHYGIALTLVTLLYITFSILSVKKTAYLQKKCNEKRFIVDSKLADSLLNFETIKYFHGRDHEEKQYNILLQQREKAVFKYRVMMQTVLLGQALIVGAGLTVLTAMAGKSVLSGQLHIGDFVLINGYLIQFVNPLSLFGMIFRDLSRNLNEIDHALDILHTPLTISENNTSPSLNPKKGNIIFKDVVFSYDHKNTTLNKISFNVPAGKTVAIVGSTGAGKSTILKLLLRLYDVDGGEICIDHQNIDRVTIASLRAAIGVVPQESGLFNDTIYNNIIYPHVQVDPQRFNQALTHAQLDRWIATLPNGINTIVGERGLSLSGGEKQRLSIARAFLKDPAIFIFDEATASLDNHTARELLRVFKAISVNKTTLIIAHRLSTIMDADLTLVLEHGQIIERGTHQALMAANGHYAAMWHEQLHTVESNAINHGSQHASA